MGQSNCRCFEGQQASQPELILNTDSFSRLKYDSPRAREGEPDLRLTTDEDMVEEGRRASRLFCTRYQRSTSNACSFYTVEDGRKSSDLNDFLSLRSGSFDRKDSQAFSITVAPEWVAVSEEERRVKEEVVEALLRRGKVKPAEVPDMMFIKFLRGYAHEKQRVEKTAEFLERSLLWRREGAAAVWQALCEQSPPLGEVHRLSLIDQSVLQGLRWFVYGVSRGGNPVVYLSIPSASAFGKLGVERCLQQHTVKMEIVEYVKVVLRRVCGWRGYKHLMVLDIGAVGMAHSKSSFRDGMKKLIEVDQFFYPEILSKMVVVNSPWVVSSLWALVKPWVDPLTVERVKIAGEPFKSLQEFIEPAQLPKEYGGEGSLGEVLEGGVRMPNFGGVLAENAKLDGPDLELFG